MPASKRGSSGVNERPSVTLTTKFLARCQDYGSERLAVQIVAAGRSAGAAGLPERETTGRTGTPTRCEAAVAQLPRKRGG